MFDLEREVDAWCRSVHAKACARLEQVDELKDHLYCEIERLRESGLDDEHAFAEATSRLGSPATLAAEYAKNDSLVSKLCALESSGARAERVDARSRRRDVVITLAHSIVFAAAMIATPLLIADPSRASTVVFAVLVPVWFATFLLLPARRRASRCERAFFRRVLGTAR